MTFKRFLVWTALFALFVVLVALFWRQRFEQAPPSLRELGGNPVGDNIHIYGESPRQDALAERALLADAQRGNPEAQYLQAMILEHVDLQGALRWYEAAATQGHQASIERLRQLRSEQAGGK